MAVSACALAYMLSLLPGPRLERCAQTSQLGVEVVECRNQLGTVQLRLHSKMRFSGAEVDRLKPFGMTACVVRHPRWCFAPALLELQLDLGFDDARRSFAVDL